MGCGCGLPAGARGWSLAGLPAEGMNARHCAAALPGDFRDVT